MMRTLPLIAAVIFSWSISLRQCSAAILAFDQFTGYTNGPLVGQGQGSGWGANLWTGTGSETVSSTGGLAHANLTGFTAGGNVSGPGSEAQGGVSRLLGTPLASPGTYYFGVLLQQVDSPTGLGSDPDSDPHNAVVGLDDGTEQARAGAWNSATTWQLQRKEGASGFGNVNTAVAESTNVIHFVIRLNLVAGTGDVARLFVNPANAAALTGAGNAVYTFTNDFTPDRITTALSNQNNSRGNYLFDEIRLGTAPEDMFNAVPEPSAFILAALSLLPILGVARRKSRLGQGKSVR